MVLPIYTYGSPILREETVPVEHDTPELQRLIDDMIETMHGAEGIGLAAPQVGRTERVFVVDLSGMAEDLLRDFGEVPPWAEGPLVFVNPEVVDEDPETACDFEEGCLSIPDLREQVTRPDRVRVRYQDRRLQEHEVEAEGLLARVVQHELDHLHGVLFVDHVGPLRRRLLRRRLRAMAAGDVEADYPLAGPVEPERA